MMMIEAHAQRRRKKILDRKQILAHYRGSALVLPLDQALHRVLDRVRHLGPNRVRHLGPSRVRHLGPNLAILHARNLGIDLELAVVMCLRLAPTRAKILPLKILLPPIHKTLGLILDLTLFLVLDLVLQYLRTYPTFALQQPIPRRVLLLFKLAPLARRAILARDQYPSLIAMYRVRVPLKQSRSGHRDGRIEARASQIPDGLLVMSKAPTKKMTRKTTKNESITEGCDSNLHGNVP